MTRLALLLLLCMSSCAVALANEPKLPPGVTCEQVQANVAQYGKIAAYAWARLQGYSAKEIREAKKCLH